MSVHAHLGEQASSLLTFDRPEACRPSEARGFSSDQIASFDLFGRAIWVNQFATLCCVFFREKTGKRDFCKSRICVKLRPIGPCDFLRLDHGVQRLGGIASHRAQIESFKDVQHLQCRDTLTIWWKLENIVATIARRNGLDPSRCMFLEIGFAQKTAISPHESVDLVSDFSFVKNVATSF